LRHNKFRLLISGCSVATYLYDSSSSSQKTDDVLCHVKLTLKV